MKPVALILDDDGDHAAALAELVASHGFGTRVFPTVAEARALPDQEQVIIAFLSLDCGGGSGLSLLDHPALGEVTEVILMNAVDEPELVNQGISQGATCFFCKPFDPDFIDSILTDLASEIMVHANGGEVGTTMDQFGLLRGGSEAMRKLYRIMRKVAPTDTSVLLVGESGTGKELVAQSLHMFSERAESEFVAMNCAAIPKELFESELFGHEKGSFSGAVRRHQGYFERAHRGTLFLDEITEMPIELQAKLLRVLELGQFRRVGGEEDLRSDARIIAATNRDPEDAIAAHALREDLYYRIARFPLWIPPLRDRQGDVRGLALFFLNELNAANHTAVVISDDALARIEAYGWPGNVRELRSVLERAYILANGRIRPEHLKGLDGETAVGDYIRVAATASVEEAERKLIFAALERYGGDKQATASSLGISLKTLYNRLNAYSKQGPEAALGNGEPSDADRK
ncbi:MAG: sigma-54 dependent transcriptional regulator [Pseudomonadales bacterium]|jgi:DNA-binding NtrC family response regulator